MKIKTGLLTLLIVLLTACTGVPMINLEAKKVTDTAEEIADFDLPDGYDADFSTSLLGYTLAAFSPGDDQSHFYLIQSEKAVGVEKLASILEQMAPGSSDARNRMTVIENRSITIRGEETTLFLSDGINSNGDTYRQATAAFQGMGGPAMFFFSEPVNQWSQARFDAFLISNK